MFSFVSLTCFFLPGMDAKSKPTKKEKGKTCWKKKNPACCPWPGPARLAAARRYSGRAETSSRLLRHPARSNLKRRELGSSSKVLHTWRMEQDRESDLKLPWSLVPLYFLAPEARSPSGDASPNGATAPSLIDRLLVVASVSPPPTLPASAMDR